MQWITLVTIRIDICFLKIEESRRCADPQRTKLWLYPENKGTVDSKWCQSVYFKSIYLLNIYFVKHRKKDVI